MLNAPKAEAHFFWGCSGWDYYEKASCRPWLQHITIPTLLFQSTDDPFMSSMMNSGNNKIEQQLVVITRTFLQEMKAECAAETVTAHSKLASELGLDSLGKVELLYRFEKVFSVKLPESAIASADTLQEIAVLIQNANPDSHVMADPVPEIAPLVLPVSVDPSSVSTLTELIRLYGTKDPERVHLYLQDEEGKEQAIRYGQLLQEAESVARGLLVRGIQSGETVGIMLPTGEDFFYAFCGALLAGAIPVPLYPPFRPEQLEEYAKREVKILQNAEARILVTFSRIEALGKILKTSVPSIKEVTTLNNLKSSGDLQNVVREPDDIVLLQYTSGSTGDPKGVTLTHACMLANIRAIGKALAVTSADVVVSWLPLYHDMGLMSWLCSLYFGPPVVILSPLTFLSRPERWLWTIHNHRATISGGPNFSLELCIKKIAAKDLEGLDLSSWRIAFNGAEAVSPETLRTFGKIFSAHGFDPDALSPGYGLAESTVGLAITRPPRSLRVDVIQRKPFEKEKKAIPANPQETDSLEFAGCGVILPGHEIRVASDEGEVLSERQIGNLQFRGPSSMRGYYRNPEATKKAWHDGWWDTGDLGYRVADEIFVTGRKKDLIIRAGRNISPEEVEKAAGKVLGLRRGCIIAFGTGSPVTGTEKLVIVAETAEKSGEDQQRIRSDIIKQVMAAVDISPDVVELVPPKTIPKTSSGKLQRSALKQAWLQNRLTKPKHSAGMQFVRLLFKSFCERSRRWLVILAKLVYTVYVTFLLVIGLLAICLITFPLSRHHAAIVARACCRIFFVLAACPLTVEGKEQLQTGKNMIYAANHASYVDSAILMALLPAGVIFVGKSEILRMPFIGRLVRKLGFVTVDRQDFSKSSETVKKIRESLESGHSLAIYPEGTFVWASGLRSFKPGAFVIAAEMGHPVCPVALQGTRVMIRGDVWLMRPNRVRVILGQPVFPEKSGWDESMRLLSAVREDIAKHCGESVIS